jgi:hypothetical protein
VEVIEMDCRAHRAVRRGPVGPGRGDDRNPISRSHRTHRRSPATDHLVRAAELVTRVAVLIPKPGEALARDDAAWSGFEALVTEAASLLADGLGHDGRATLCALVASPLSADPLCLLLMEQALGKLATDRG